MERPSLWDLRAAGLRIAKGESTVEQEAVAYTLTQLAGGLSTTRGELQAIVDGWTPEQLRMRPPNYEQAAETEDRWSATEAISHLLVTQNWYLLHMGRLLGRREHFDALPRGLGDAAQQDVPQAELSARLHAATEQMLSTIAAIPAEADLEARRDSTYFGELSLRGWVFLAISHDLDHLAQLRRVARAHGFLPAGGAGN